MKKVSIIIPAYNKGKYIATAIKSALKQTYKNLEVIISDNCSTDNTQEIIKKFGNDGRVKYYRNKKNLGRVGNYKKALYQYATGDYVLMLDADDYLTDPNYIKDAIGIFKKDKDIALIFAKQKVFFQADNSIVEDKINEDLPMLMDGNWLFLNYYKNCSICQLTTIYDRYRALEKGYYKENIISTDVESTLRMLINNKVGFLNRFVGVWNKHEENASRTINIKEVIDNTRYIDSPYEYALSDKLSINKMLAQWRKKMLKKYFCKTLVKVLLLNKAKLKKLMDAIKKYDKTIYYSLILDFKMIFLRVISKSDKLLYFFIKDVIKLESFIKDLALYKTNE